MGVGHVGFYLGPDVIGLDLRAWLDDLLVGCLGLV